MKIIETLGNKKLDTKTKLDAVKELVKVCRKTYGNKDAEIGSVKVNSVNGMVSVGLLTKAEKVAVAEQQIRYAISNATVVAENVEGSVFDRAFEMGIATNPILTNLNEKSDSQY